MTKGYQKGMREWARRRSRLLILAFVLTSVFTGWRLWVLLSEDRFMYLQISMAASIGGVAQVYYDTGHGFSEEASARLEVFADDRFREYGFRLPRVTIHSLRFDPLMSGGTISIRDISLVDGLGRSTQAIDRRWVLPGQQIEAMKSAGDLLVVVMSPGADPQLALALPTPIRPTPSSLQDQFLRLGWRVLLEVSAFLGCALVVFLVLRWLRKTICPGNRRMPMALLLALLAVGVMEGFQHLRLPSQKFYHEVDELLYRLGRERFDADAVILGNSVAYQVFNHPSFLERKHVAMLATNEAIGMTGQYFIMKRYLERNRLPRTVILLTLPRLEGSLSDEKADNYICRTFTRPAEILDVLLLKRDPVFALRSLFYRLCPSFKYRLRLQKDWLGFTNAPIYTGAAPAGRSAQSEHYALTQMLMKMITRKDIPRRHFIKLLDLLDEKNVPLHFIIPPLKEGNKALQRQYLNAMTKEFPSLANDHPLLFWRDRLVLYPDRLVGDDVHFTEEGLRLARPYLFGLVDEVVGGGWPAKRGTH